MKTLMIIALACVTVALLSYLFNSASDFKEVKNQKGICNEEDYEIASRLETRTK